MGDETDQLLPKARSKGLLIREVGDEVLVYDLDRHKAHCLNKTAAMIWNQCDGKKTVSQIVGVLGDEAGSSVSEEVVWLGLTSLQKVQLLAERISHPPGASRLTRREVIRRVGIAAAVGLPIVTSIIAPRATEAATCKVSGAPCAANSECCSGSCPGAPTGACA